MGVENLEVYFQDGERASGAIISRGDRVPWTAVRSGGSAWMIVLHERVDIEDACLLKQFLAAIQTRLKLKKAA